MSPAKSADEDTLEARKHDDDATSRDLVSLLAVTLTLMDYAATEKVSDLSKRLSTEGAPAARELTQPTTN